MTQTFTALPLLIPLTLGLITAAGFLKPVSAHAVESEMASDASDSSESTGTDSADTAAAEADTAIAAPSTCGALQVIGTQLSDQDGNPVQLKGISSHGLSWYPEYINEECFSEFKNDWNMNLIRLAMYTAESGGYCTDGDQEALKALVKSGVNYATDLDMYVIIDWHILSDGNPNTYIEEAKAFFEEMSSEFADNINILYEICNEPNGSTTWADIKAYAAEIIPIIRANDPDAVILVGTPNWSQYVDQAAADPITGYDNIMYTLHYYAATHTDSLRNTLVSAHNAGLPIFVSEYGICDASGNGGLDIDQANQWMELLDDYQISCAMWNLSHRDESSAILKSGCTKTSGFTADDLNDSGKWLYEMLTGESMDGTSLYGSTDSGSESSNGSDSGDASSGSESSDSDSAGGTNGGSSSASSGSDSSGSLEYTASVTNQWESNGMYYFQYTLKVKNTSGNAVSGWSITLDFNNSITLSDGWNGEYAVSGSALTITPKDYNSQVEAGGALSDIGFIIYSSSSSLTLE
ncbi:MAG: cellulase family glycosylhydrolase [Lachnospiraceae bacterium]|nr:cellulase family glycosylhydrolase [Lachnospiraceae bacterium]